MPSTPATVRGSIRDLVRTHERRRRLFPRALLAGLLTGAVALAFRQSLTTAEHLLSHLVGWARGLGGWGLLVPVAYGAVGGGLAVWLTQRFAPEIAGSGIPFLKAAVHRMRRFDWWRVLPLKFLGGVLAIGSGMALGREGPTVQMGGACGQWVGRWSGSTPRERRSLIAAGAGAGLAAAFNAPLAGVVFVLEEVQRDFSPALLTATFVASMVADVVARVLFGQGPVYLLPEFPAPPLPSLLFFLGLGIVCGVGSVAFNRTLLFSLSAFEPLRQRLRGLAGVIAGAAVGLAVWLRPETAASGHQILDRVFSNELVIPAILGLIALRFAMTMLSYGSGAPGGIFAPILVLGGLTGLAVGQAAHLWTPEWAPNPVVFAVAGMAALFSGVVRGPLTGIVLIMEMTGNDGLLLQLLVSCFAAYLVAEALGERPVYEALLGRDLERASPTARMEEPVLLHFTVEEGAPFAGKQVGELGLPPGCLLVGLEHPSGRSEVPSRTSRLRPGARITVLVDPDATEAASQVLEGATGRSG